jgi:hypothetical protein
MAAQTQPWAWRLDGSVAACIEYAFFCTFSSPGFSNIPCRFISARSSNSLFVIRLYGGVTRITELSRFGVASAALTGNKEAANSSNMTYTFFDSPRHYPNRSGCRNGVLHRLS